MQLGKKLTVGGFGTAAIGFVGFAGATSRNDAIVNFCGWVGLDCPAVEATSSPTKGVVETGAAPTGVPSTKSPASTNPPAEASPIKVVVEPVLKAEDITGQSYSLIGMMQFRLTNGGATPAHVAWSQIDKTSQVVLDNGTSLHMDTGHGLKGSSLKGVADCEYLPEVCWQTSSNVFTIIQPGQTVSAYADFRTYLQDGKLRDAAAVKAASLSAKLYVVVPAIKFHQVQSIDFIELPVKNTLN